MQYSRNSKIKELLQNPVGRDIARKLSLQTGRDLSAIAGIAGNMRIGTLPKLFPNAVDDTLVDTVLTLANANPGAAPVRTGPAEQAWWKSAVFYQIYPRSFCGQPVLRGICARLDYLRGLGVDCLWLSPVYDSPLDDNGYDIRDYRAIAADLGTMADFDELLAQTHKRGMRLIMDLVVNHTSDEHVWFQKSIAAEQPYSDYYIWKRGKAGGPPNNWQSFFGGGAWKEYTQRGEWALHTFSPKQMDLNWECPALREEIYDMAAWWLDKGVDGFRLDVINLISKMPGLPDGNKLIGGLMGYRGIEHYFYGPRLHEYLREFHAKCLAGRDCVAVGETPGVGREMARLLCCDSRGELSMIFSFDHLENPGKTRWDEYDYDLAHMKKFVIEQGSSHDSGCHAALYFENHDNPRMSGKVTKDPVHTPAVAKLLAMLLLTLKGAPFIYQGQELGTTNQPLAREDLRDIESINKYEEVAAISGEERALRVVNAGSRDHARRPIDWSEAQRQAEDPESVLEFYKKLLALRSGSGAFAYGEFLPVDERGKHTFCYCRQADGEKFYIETNLTDTPQKAPMDTSAFRLLLASDAEEQGGVLPPYCARIYGC